MLGGGKVVAHLRHDGNVYPTQHFVQQYLTKQKKNLNEVEGKTTNTATVVDLGKQMLQYAKDSDLRGIRNIISRGAPFTSDWLGMSALHFAAMNNEYEICDVLLKGGCNKDYRSKVDRTPLHIACFYGHYRIVELLLAHKCAVNSRDMLLMTPLHWAVEKLHKNVVRLLLKHNADVTLISKFGRTPIGLAVQTEQADILEELQEAKTQQARKQLNEENEKETTEAVSSIMNMGNIIQEPDNLSEMDDKKEDEEEEDMHNFIETSLPDLDAIQETTTLDTTAINLLKSHGITMMEDNNESKDVLDNALKNGRKLVLSEGGKLLLNETKRSQETANNDIKIIRNLNASKHTEILSTTTRLKNSTTNIKHISGIRSHVITKAKDTINNSNKNVRIISLNDFKKIYGTTDLRAISKLPAIASNNRMIKTIQTSGVGANKSEKQIFDILNANKSNIKNDNTNTMPSTLSKPKPQPIQLISSGKRLEGERGVVHLSQLSNANIISNQQKHDITLDKQSKQMTSMMSTIELCRQMIELRKSNEELKKTLELVQQHNDSLQKRVEHLEELFLVERDDENAIES